MIAENIGQVSLKVRKTLELGSLYSDASQCPISRHRVRCWGQGSMVGALCIVYQKTDNECTIGFFCLVTCRWSSRWGDHVSWQLSIFNAPQNKPIIYKTGLWQTHKFTYRLQLMYQKTNLRPEPVAKNSSNTIMCYFFLRVSCPVLSVASQILDSRVVPCSRAIAKRSVSTQSIFRLYILL